MILPSVYVFTLFLITTSYGDEEDDFCKLAYEDIHDAYNCSSDTTGPTNLTKIPSVVTPAEKQQTLIKDQPGAIYIDFRGYPPSDFVWQIDGVKLNITGRYSVEMNGTLLISKVRSENAGIYSAVGKKDFVDKKSGNINVTVIDELEIIDASDRDYEVDLEKKFSLHCCFYSQPYCPKIKWYKDGVEINDGLTIQKIDGGRTLEVHATSDSKGKYTCNATTPYGESASHSISVTVSRRCTGDYNVEPSQDEIIKAPKGSRKELKWSFICFGKLHIAAVTCRRNHSVEITEYDQYYSIARNRTGEPDNEPALKHTITILNVSRSENISCRTDDYRSPVRTYFVMMEDIKEINAKPQLGSSFFNEKGVWIVIGVSLLLSFVAVLFLLWYRRRVSRKEMIFYNHKEKETKVLYDAFISFSEADGGSFVRSTLQPMLEDECGYILSLHYREFPPGAAIVDSIINCIYDSRRIVIVVTPKFLDSEWCKFEVNQGLRRAIKRPNSVIVVMLNEMPLDRLPKPLRSFLSDVTFLLWDDGKREEMRKKMKRALGKPYTVKSGDGQDENIETESSAKDAGRSELQRNGKKCNPSVQVSSDNEVVDIV